MRTVFRSLSWLALATLLSLAFQLAEEQVTFSQKLHWPPGWYALEDSSRGRVMDPGGGALPVCQVQGTIQQQIHLVNGGGRPVVIGFLYRSPKPGAWIGLVGDTTPKPVAELSLKPSHGLKAPSLPDKNNLYQVSLPPSASWTPITIWVHENTPDLPALTLYLAGPESGADFRNVSLSYQNHPKVNLLENGDFTESWPVEYVHPKWLMIPTDDAVSIMPARLTLSLLIFFWVALGIVYIRSRKIQGDRAPRWASAVRGLAAAVWLLSSALMMMGSSSLHDAVLVALSGMDEVFRGGATLPTWLIQIALFVFVGRVGAEILGPRARIGAVLIPLIAAKLISTSQLGVFSQSGGPTVIDNWSEGSGFLWIVAGIAAIWGGVNWWLAEKAKG